MLSYNNKITFISLIICTILLNFCFAINVYAVSNAQTQKNNIGDTINETQKEIDNTARRLDYKTETKNINSVIREIISIALSFIGVIFLIIMLLSGYQWMTAGGDAEQVSKSKEKIKNAAIGLAIVFLAYIIAMFILTIATTLNPTEQTT